MKKYLNGELVEMTEEEVAATIPSLSFRQETIVGQIEDLRDEKLRRYPHDFGVGYGVLHLQLRDTEDRTNWLTLRTTVADLVSSGSGTTMLSLRTEENITVPMSASGIAQVLNSMSLYAMSIMAKSWELKDSARGSSDPETIDILTGW